MVECLHENTIKQDGIYVTCIDCGEVLEIDNFESHPPRHYSSDDDSKIQHAPFDKFIGRGSSMQVPGKPLSKKLNVKYMRLSKQDNWRINITNKKAQEVRIVIVSFLNSYDLVDGNIMKTINYYILKTNNINLQGCSLDSYCAALIIYVFRECGLPFGIKNILKYFGAKFSPTVRLLRRLIVKYNLKNIPPLSLHKYIVYYVIKISNIYNFEDSLLVKLQADGLKYVKKVERSRECRGNKLCITAGIIYHIFKVAKIPVPQNVIANVINITTVSLRSTYIVIKKL